MPYGHLKVTGKKIKWSSFCVVSCALLCCNCARICQCPSMPWCAKWNVNSVLQCINLRTSHPILYCCKTISLAGARKGHLGAGLLLTRPQRTPSLHPSDANNRKEIDNHIKFEKKLYNVVIKTFWCNQSNKNIGNRSQCAEKLGMKLRGSCWKKSCDWVFRVVQPGLA